MNNKDTKSGYSFRILYEEASESDLFPDKTHEEVKNNLFNLIENSEKGVTIGLEGGWGSGKTTVINFLNDAIKKSKENTLFFSFDAWAHEGDPLRRIFLESLISEIDSDGKDEYLNRLLKEISGRVKTVDVKTKKKLRLLQHFYPYQHWWFQWAPLFYQQLTTVNYFGLLILKPHRLTFHFYLDLFFVEHHYLLFYIGLNMEKGIRKAS